jgi:hypothetical protein
MTKSRRMRWAGACSSRGSEEACVQGKPGGKRAVGGLRRRWEDTVKIDRREI